MVSGLWNIRILKLLLAINAPELSYSESFKN